MQELSILWNRQQVDAILCSIIFQDIGCAPDILTMNMTHTGELGYVFYIPTEFALHVYDELVEAGKVIIAPPPFKGT